jgi:hypothetical protein
MLVVTVKAIPKNTGDVEIRGKLKLGVAARFLEANSSTGNVNV